MNFIQTYRQLLAKEVMRTGNTIVIGATNLIIQIYKPLPIPCGICMITGITGL